MNVAMGRLVYQLTVDEAFRFAPLSVSRRTIDCPMQGPSGEPGRNRRPASAWRVDGALQKLHLGSRTIEVDDVTLAIEADTVILIDCQRASFRELRELQEGTLVTALYEDRGGRDVVTVLEAEHIPH